MMTSYEKESTQLSRALTAVGVSKFVNVVNRQAVHYESTLTNAFEVECKSEVLVSGSMGDGLGLFYGYGRVDKTSDTDIVIILKHKITEDVHEDADAMLVKRSDLQSPGYVRLQLVADNFMRQFCEKENGTAYISNKLWMKKISDEYIRRKHSPKVHGPAIDVSLPPSVIAGAWKSGEVAGLRISDPEFNTRSPTGVDKTDMVTCLECKTWPVEAEEWKTRKRPSGWPSKKLTENVVQTGCILAPVGNKESPHKALQWRLCNNKGEALLTESFNEIQLQCYYLLKVINNDLLKEASKKNITSYIIKTTMFWISEMIPPDEWHPRLLVSCYCKALKQLRNWVQERFLPNYFIVERNMFFLSEFSEEIATETIQAIDNVLRDPISSVLRLELIRQSDISVTVSKSDADVLFAEIYLWLISRQAMATNFYFTGNQIIPQAHKFKNIRKSIERCETVLHTLQSQGGYFKPTCDQLHNSLGVLYYAYALENDTDGYWRKTAHDYLRTSASIDHTHAPLRIATCLLLDKEYGNALDLINKTLANINHKEQIENECEVLDMLYFTDRSEFLIDQAVQYLKKLKSEENLSELKQLHSIVKRDIENQDMEQTEKALEKIFPEFYDVHLCFWRVFSFDVIFTSAELMVLPYKVRLEAEMKESKTIQCNCVKCKGIFIFTLHPKIYAWYLKFLANFEIMRSHPTFDHSGRCKFLDECRRNVSGLCKSLDGAKLPVEQRVVGYNLLAHSCVLVGCNRAAAQSLMCSLRLNSEHQRSSTVDNFDKNVAYHFFKIIIKALLKIDYKQKCTADP